MSVVGGLRNASLVIESRLQNPFINAALGSYFARKVGTEFPNKILFLSSSHEGVLIGRNQNCWDECDMQKMKEDKVPLLRRETGGGACYVDRGNRLFSFIEATSNPQIKKYYPVVVRALNQLDLKGQTATMQGSNDISIGSKKISGSACSFDGRAFRHHGTVLFNVDKTKLSKYLTPSKIKLESKGITSVKMRICNLVEINSRLTQEQLDAELIKSYESEIGGLKEVLVIDKKNLEIVLRDHRVYEMIYKRLTSDEFRFNANPIFSHRFEHKFSFGNLEVLISCSDNKIVECKIFSDSLDVFFIDQLQKVLLGKEYRMESILPIMDELLEVMGEGYKKGIEEFCKVLSVRL